jgi:hypothetical protein
MKAMKMLAIGFLMLASLAGCGEGAREGADGQGDEGVADAGVEGCVEGEEIETDSGLRIKDITCGQGVEAEGDSAVVVHYVGKFEDGTTFDSSRAQGEPVPFRLGVGQLIPGFEEGIRGMRAGGLRELTIPPELGYGEQGSGDIPPDSTLIFEVELISVEETAPMGG